MEIEVELQNLVSQDGLVVEAVDSEGVAAGWASTLERLASAAGMLEQAVERIVAAGESKREAELEQKLAAALAEVSELRASGGALGTGTAKVTNGRKTLPVAMVSLLAKQGVTVDSVEAGALDAALVSLSIEQRIAVKAQLMRAGLLG
jgi:hypothetical protein